MASLAEAVRGVDLVQENGPELVEIKRELFAELDRLAPDGAILASSTSAIVASRFTETLAQSCSAASSRIRSTRRISCRSSSCAARPGRRPTSSSARGGSTSAVGQVPIVVNREVEGFVLNRLQGALLSEALRLVGEGDRRRRTISTRRSRTDSACAGLSSGPFETIELNAPGGIADYCARYGGFYRRLAADAPKPEVWDEAGVARILAAWDETPAADRLAAKSAWRDARLTALRAHKAAQTPSDAA